MLKKDADDEERILLKRESLKHEERIEKATIRSQLADAKQRGYEKIREEDIKLIKVFIGYITELYPENLAILVDALIVSIKNETVSVKILEILSKKIKNLDEIIKILSL